MEKDLRRTLQALDLGGYIDVLQRNRFMNWITLSKVREEDL